MTDGLDVRNGTILIVCTGNVCRSPYIERRLSAALDQTNITVSSAGTGALVGSGMDPRVQGRLRGLGLSSEGFVARQLTPEMAIAADLILAATREHRSLIVRMQPRVLRRTYALADFSDLAAHLLRSDLAELIRSGRSTDNFVRAVSAAATRCRGEVRARTADEAEIIDPYRRPDKILDRMIQQVDVLAPAIATILTTPLV